MSSEKNETGNPEQSSPRTSEPTGDIAPTLTNKPIYLDSASKERLRRLATEDAPYLLLSHINAPTYGLYNIQRHIKSHCAPTVITQGREVGALHASVVAPLAGKVKECKELIEGLRLAEQEFDSMNSDIRRAIDAHRGDFRGSHVS
eukprot:Tbor_TRINITY_DN5001_c0_g4::TRINITY_DN5001_c0_g4_i1::g.14419::m.14419